MFSDKLQDKNLVPGFFLTLCACVLCVADTMSMRICNISVIYLLQWCITSFAKQSERPTFSLAIINFGVRLILKKDNSVQNVR